jgi:hypothetical protein
MRARLSTGRTRRTPDASAVVVVARCETGLARASSGGWSPARGAKQPRRRERFALPGAGAVGSSE